MNSTGATVTLLAVLGVEADTVGVERNQSVV
jgi:hypothetical protein